MAYGVIEYDEDGLPKCEICGKYFNRVLSHVRQKHDMNEREYKIQFGFDLGKGICSIESAERTRVKTLQNFDKVIGNNLILKGNVSRFKKGHKGRTREQVSAQTKQMLLDRLKLPKMVAAMKESGKIVGKSGLGNLKRWGKKD